MSYRTGTLLTVGLLLICGLGSFVSFAIDVNNPNVSSDWVLFEFLSFVACFTFAAYFAQDLKENNDSEDR